MRVPMPRSRWGAAAKTISSLVVLAVLVCMASPVRALPSLGRPINYTYDTLDYPGAIITFAFGVNDAGPAIVGAYVDPGSNLNLHGWLLSGSAFATIDFPGSTRSDLNGINNRGGMVGGYIDGNGHEHGYLLSAGTFTAIDFPGAIDTETDAINDAGDIVGGYGPLVASVFQHGFLLSHGEFTGIDLPGAAATWPEGINNRGEITGTYVDAAGIHHGFLLAHGVFTVIDFPGAVHTIVRASNDRGEIVGRYVTDGNAARTDAQHAFLLSSGRFYTVDPPGWTGRAIATGINNQGQMVGLFRDSVGRHGFLATPAGVP